MRFTDVRPAVRYIELMIRLNFEESAILAVICTSKFTPIMNTPFLYIGPGLGVGAGILIVLVLVLIVAAFGYRIWYTIKKARKK
ncbi:hypothetical protein N9L53_00430 [Schleiferiaceae bacterium]|nr:hypothetical protein [Schleiferiaceae bacterium]MDA9560901.1 hypothetical protein [Schleiferiaceae bacterium]MDC3183470.1 hypothetical protein [Schleiferiaceae bacterium]